MPLLNLLCHEPNPFNCEQRVQGSLSLSIFLPSLFC